MFPCKLIGGNVLTGGEINFYLFSVTRRTRKKIITGVTCTERFIDKARCFMDIKK